MKYTINLNVLNDICKVEKVIKFMSALIDTIEDGSKSLSSCHAK